MPQPSHQEKIAILEKSLDGIIPQFEAAWLEASAKGVDYETYLMTVFTLFATGVKNLSHHPSHIVMFAAILADCVPGIMFATLQEDEAENG